MNLKRKLKSTLAIVLSVAVMFTFIPVMGTTAMAASKAGTPKNLKCTYKELTNSSFTKGMAKISWSKSKGAKGYKVYYKAGSKYKALGTTSKVSYTVKNLKEGKSYSIKVKAYKDKKKSKTYSSYSKALNVKVSKKELGVKAYNGNMIGTVDNGVYTYKGVHFAQDAGTAENRWQKPVPVEASDEDVDASEFGKMAFQVPWHSEDASVKEQGEDCLTLDVWTNSPNDSDAKKPVFVWIHGGAHILGGTDDPIYYGQSIIEECGDDVVFVSLNYRLNCMGIMNFSEVEGGEDYKDAGWLPLYDNIEALRWIKKNITQFGGDPDQVTIAGESAGGAQVSLLPLMSECKDEKLFNKVICESGNPSFTSLEEYTYDPTKIMMDGYQYAEALDPDDEYDEIKGLGYGKKPTMDDLAKLPEDEMWTLMYYCQCCTWDEELGRACATDETAGAFNYPIRGGQDNPLLNARFDESVEKMAEQYQNLDYFDLMIGSTSNEYDYWIGEMTNKYKYDKKGNVMTYTALDGSQKPVIDTGALPTEGTYGDYWWFNYIMGATWNARYSKFEELGIDSEIDTAMDEATEGNTGADKGISKNAMKGSMLATEVAFALPAQLIANNHSKSKGNTYMYYWKHPSTVTGFNAGHAVELAYVFGVDSDDYFCPFCGDTDDALMDKTMKTWISFVKEGEPTVANQDITWPQYDEKNKRTMIVNDTSENPDWTVEADPDNKVRDLLTNKDGTQTPIVEDGQTYKSYFDYTLRKILVKGSA